MLDKFQIKKFPYYLTFFELCGFGKPPEILNISSSKTFIEEDQLVILFDFLQQEMNVGDFNKIMEILRCFDNNKLKGEFCNVR